MAPTPYASGESRREQGISKAGNRRVRWMMVRAGVGLAAVSAGERTEPMVHEEVAAGNARLRKVGIVALARKLLIALWKYVEGGEAPEGAEEVGWEKKLPREGGEAGGRRGRRREGIEINSVA